MRRRFLVTYFLLETVLVGFVIGLSDIYGIGVACHRRGAGGDSDSRGGGVTTALGPSGVIISVFEDKEEERRRRKVFLSFFLLFLLRHRRFSRYWRHPRHFGVKITGRNDAGGGVDGVGISRADDTDGAVIFLSSAPAPLESRVGRFGSCDGVGGVRDR